MRTPLNLQSLAEQGLAGARPGGGWALTQEGVDWIVQDRELSDR
jgi:predicted transcriptional regulator